MIGYFVHLISIVIYIIEIMVLVRGIVCLKMNKLPRGMYVVKNIINYYTAVITIFVIVDCVYYMLSENFNGILISSGIVLCIMLVVSGKLFNLLYQWSKDKKAEDKILEKVAEECGEVLLAAKNDENLVYESVDLIFHTLLILVYKGIEIDEIFEEFARRRH